MKKRVLSGIQPSGILTLGNYIGAMQNFVQLQEQAECYFMIVDLHAITVPQNPKDLFERSKAVTALYLAAGIDPKKANIFLQSHVPEHAELCWMLTTLTSMGELERMTQFKDKAAGKETIGAGLFTYPVLMAADVLLYQANYVPVGEDQKQHLELTRDLAHRFNSRYAPVFTIPEPYIPKHGARIMSLQDARQKMSKSSSNVNSFISLLDAPEVIRKKIGRAITDSGSEIKYDVENKPEISNLLTIYSACTKTSIEEAEKHFAGQMYGTFKKEVAESVITVIEPLQQRYQTFLDMPEMDTILREGAEKAKEIASQTLRRVKAEMGFYS